VDFYETPLGPIPLDRKACDTLLENPLFNCHDRAHRDEHSLELQLPFLQVMLEKGCLDIYQPDATMGGGISDAKRVLDACGPQNLVFAPHTWTNGLGFLINLQVYAGGPRDHPLEYPYEPPGWVPEARDGILREPILVDGKGTVAVPEAPGLGIDIDEEKLARYGEKFFEITSRGIAMKTIREKGLFTALRLARKKRRSKD